MSSFNSQRNRAVWFDVPVTDLDRATTFYAAVLSVPVQKEQSGDYKFAVIDHHDGNGGCLVPGNPQGAEGGILIYLNVNGRIRDAVQQVERLGGKTLEPIHSLGPHGYRTLILDCEGNRLALHSETDA